ncbi:MAG: xanthine dehydrogenase family protein subunit M [Verrucomicrobia bacterium]|nr:xanthine dehydrogenase family protein subunit M [Verrucomicrobiota bacterium]
MIPSAFEYLRPQTFDDAINLFAQHGENAKILAGGHSLIPTMKLRLAQPKVLIDLGRIADLNYIREQDGKIAVGAMATHHQIETSELLREKCPLLCEVAPQIGDVQVRNRGTIGGSLAHADPAADWPAAILALDAELEVAGPDGARVIQAKKFFVDLFQTALKPNELLREIRLPATSKAVAYVKFAQRASGFAIAGAAVVIRPESKAVGIGITGVAAKAYRATASEKKLEGQPLASENIAAAADKASNRVEALNDIHASADFRKHLARVNTKRALELAAARAER